jgi:Helix-turn-helix of DDE superfamily endonuclease/DDE superfamily endonuclease
MITYARLKEKPKAFLAATGLHVNEFEQLLPRFQEKLVGQRPPDNQTTQGKPRQRRGGAGPKERLRTVEDKLVFILVYQKTYPLQTMLGLHFGLSQPRANYWIHGLLPILQEVLAEMGMTPERDPQAVADHPLVNEAAPDLLIDGTERRRQRPIDPQQQEAHYSGKKKAHTDKNLLLANVHTKKVIYLGPTESGKKHDKKLADEAPISYPTGATLGKDTGFQGYEPQGVVTFQPQKSQEARS